jgi:AcrR family transcriptional regulator
MDRESSSRLSRADWVALGWKALREGGPSALTVERLTLAPGRSEEGFHRHFKSIGFLVLAVARYWFDAEGKMLEHMAASGETPVERLWAVLGLTGGDDPPLERSVRALAADYREVADLVRSADDRREGVLTGLLAGAFHLPLPEAQHYARLLQGIHIATLTRKDDEVVEFVSGPVRALMSLLESNFPIEPM